MDELYDFDVEDAEEFPFLIEGFYLSEDEKTFDLPDSLSIEIKYPDKDDYNDAENAKIQAYVEEYMQAVWQTLKTGESVTVKFRDNPVSFTDLVEVSSFIDLYLVNEIMQNAEGMSRSVYMYKTTNGKLKFGPAWDFDLQFENYNI